MRLSKRQLKRIIREEYSKLKRRGLISEMVRITNEDMLYDARELVEMSLDDQTILDIAAYGKESEFAYNHMQDMSPDQIDDIRDLCSDLGRNGYADPENGLEQAMVLWELCSGIEQRIRYEMYTESKRRRSRLIKESYDNPNLDSEWDIDEEGMPLQSLADCAADQVAEYFTDSVMADLDACGIVSPSDLDNALAKGCSEETNEAIQMAFEGLDMDGSGHWEYQDYTIALYDALYS